MKVGQTWNMAEIWSFFTQKTPILHFLALSVFFAVLVVVFLQPEGLLEFTSQISGVHPQIQVAAMVAAGMACIVASRCLLRLHASRYKVSPMGLVIWLLVELVGVVTVMALVLWWVSGQGKLYIAPLTRDILLLIVAIESLPYVITILVFRLNQEHAEVLRLQAMLESVQSSPEEQPPAVNEQSLAFYDKAGRLVFSTLGSNILYAEAADNYVNIHYLNEGREETFILHNTLKELERTFGSTMLIRCHRCYMVNIENVKLLRREGGVLLLEMEGTSKIVNVTKTYSQAVMQRLGAKGH